jgi:hypothetical protein
MRFGIDCWLELSFLFIQLRGAIAGRPDWRRAHERVVVRALAS